jgi:MFS family permease
MTQPDCPTGAVADERVAQPVQFDPGSRRRTILAVVAGNFVEWYDFSVYAYFAVVIAPLFFPSGNPTARLLATFAVFGVAFAFRPFGALIFGRLGDRIGRRRTMAIVVLLMSGATTALGLLPTYAQIALAAPVLLVLARALQGLSAGGEYANATSYLVENSSPRRRGLTGSWAYTGIGLALLVGALVGAVARSMIPLRHCKPCDAVAAVQATRSDRRGMRGADRRDDLREDALAVGVRNLAGTGSDVAAPAVLQHDRPDVDR